MATEMATESHTLPQSESRALSSRRRAAEPSIRDIISQARSAPPSSKGAWLLCGLTAVLLWASFTPLDWGPLGWLALVPLILLIRIPQPTRWMLRVVYVGGLTFWVVSLQWMRLGDLTMYPAWWALAAYLAFYFPAFVALSRVAVHRFSVPLAMAVPVVWVGLEFVRAHLMTGFSWYYLGHTQYRWIELIQVSDLVGAYGVSFVMALSAAAIAGLVPATLFERLRLLPAGATAQSIPRPSALGVIVAVVGFSAALGYGYVRRDAADFRQGPRVGIVQGNFTSSVKQDEERWYEMLHWHEFLTYKAVQQQPDLIVWPESMFPWPLREADADMTPEELQRVAPRAKPEFWRDTTVPDKLQQMTEKAGTPIIFGVNVLRAERDRVHVYNSAALVSPDFGLRSRYDKLHRVLFGEYIPLQDVLPVLHRFTPFSANHGIDAGTGATVFELDNWRFAPIICFEDTVPHLVRGIVKSTAEPNSDQSVDCLVNLTNDGWFHGSSELDQHLITSAFRAVECRTPLVRAVNTGISAVIDGDGVIREPELFIDGDRKGRNTLRDPETGRWHKALNATLVDTVPLDNRRSFYVEYGDWFAGACGLFCGFLVIGGFFKRRKAEKPEAR